MSDAEQTEPVMDQHSTTDAEKLDGLVAQMHADLAGEDPATVEQALRHRLDDTGLEVDASAIADLVARISAS